jgi:hypothetical protein
MTSAAIGVDAMIGRLYRARTQPEFVDVPGLSVLMIDGHGDPNASILFQKSVQALFAVSYRLKFALKRAGAPAFRVAPRELVVGRPHERLHARGQVCLEVDADGQTAGRGHARARAGAGRRRGADEGPAGRA